MPVTRKLWKVVLWLLIGHGLWGIFGFSFLLPALWERGSVFGFLGLLGISLGLAFVALKSYKDGLRRERRKFLSDRQSKVTEPPSGLSAAAVRELLELAAGTDETDSRTGVAVILEMVQEGTLEIVVDKAEPTGSKKLTYRLVERAAPKNVWERALCDGLPQESLRRSELRRRLSGPELAINQHLRKHLHDRGLLSREHITGKRSGQAVVAWLWWSLLNWIGRTWIRALLSSKGDRYNGVGVCLVGSLFVLWFLTPFVGAGLHQSGRELLAGGVLVFPSAWSWDFNMSRHWLTLERSC